MTTRVIHQVKEWPVSAQEDDEAGSGLLRSTKEVTGYHIAASDGEFGHVEDFLIDDKSWAVRYLVVDTRNWLPGRKVLLSPKWLESIHWVDETVIVNFNKESIKNSPEFYPDQLVDRRYESALYDHYGQPYYWE